MDTTLSPNMAHYLKAIFELGEPGSEAPEKDWHAARPREIADRLSVRQSSVTSALKWLAEHGLIHYQPFGEISLTDEGRQLASDLVHRKQILGEFFSRVLTMAPEEAEETACMLEHTVSPETLEQFTRFAQLIEVCPEGGARWVSGLGTSCGRGVRLDVCAHCPLV